MGLLEVVTKLARAGAWAIDVLVCVGVHVQNGQ
jgi:hypothetical protein